MKIQNLRNKIEQLKGQRSQIVKSIQTIKGELKQKRKDLVHHEQAREIIKEVGIQTQNKLRYHISDITSLALESVFPNPYELAVEFIQKNNKTECELSFVRDGEKFKPKDDSGVGSIDVAAFSLMVASWSMQTPRSDNVIILDEPFKHLKGRDANLNVLKMIQTVSKKLGLQIIMVSDERISREDIIDNADRVFEISMINKRSKITQL